MTVYFVSVPTASNSPKPAYKTQLRTSDSRVIQPALADNRLTTRIEYNATATGAASSGRNGDVPYDTHSGVGEPSAE